MNQIVSLYSYALIDLYGPSQTTLVFEWKGSAAENVG